MTKTSFAPQQMRSGSVVGSFATFEHASDVVIKKAPIHNENRTSFIDEAVIVI